MIEEKPIDFGGEEILTQDFVSDDLICKIKGLNPNLGKPMDMFGNGDPLYERYQQHRNEIENAELIIIDANALNKSSIMNLNLANDSSAVEDLASDFFQLVGETLMIAFGKEDYDLNITTNPDKGFEAYSNWGETEFSPFVTDGY